MRSQGSKRGGFRGGDWGRTERRKHRKKKKKATTTHRRPARDDLHPLRLERALDQVDLFLRQEQGQALALLLEGREPLCFFDVGCCLEGGREKEQRRLRSSSSSSSEKRGHREKKKTKHLRLVAKFLTFLEVADRPVGQGRTELHGSRASWIRNEGASVRHVERKEIECSSKKKKRSDERRANRRERREK